MFVLLCLFIVVPSWTHLDGAVFKNSAWCLPTGADLHSTNPQHHLRERIAHLSGGVSSTPVVVHAEAAVEVVTPALRQQEESDLRLMSTRARCSTVREWMPLPRILRKYIVKKKKLLQVRSRQRSMLLKLIFVVVISHPLLVYHLLFIRDTPRLIRL